MSINNFAILNFLYNCIDTNNQGICNCIHVHNTDSFSNYRPPKILVLEITVLL